VKKSKGADQSATIVRAVELSAAFWTGVEGLTGALSGAERAEITDTLSMLASMADEPRLTPASVRAEMVRVSLLDDAGLAAACDLMDAGALAEVDRARHKMRTLDSANVAAMRAAVLLALHNLPPVTRGAASKAGRLDFAAFVEALADARGVAPGLSKDGDGSPRVQLARLLLAAVEGRKRPQSLDVAHRLLTQAKKQRGKK